MSGPTHPRSTGHSHPPVGTTAEQNLTYVGFVPVADKTDELRRHAQHCRELTHDFSDERLRTILFTMANEFEQQADKIDTQEAEEPGH